VAELRYLDDYRQHDTPAMRKAAREEASKQLHAQWWRDVRNMAACIIGVLLLGIPLLYLLIDAMPDN